MTDKALVPTVTLNAIEHPFNRTDRSIHKVDWRPGLTLAVLINQHLPEGLRVRAYLNGQFIPEEHWHMTYPRPGDMIAVAPDMGDGFMDIFRIILMIMVVAAAIFVPGMIPGLSAATQALLGMGIGLVGGLLVNALLPSPSPKLGTSDNALASRAYSWSPHNTEQQGIPIPKWYGKNRVYGNIITSFIDTTSNTQYLNLVISMGLGPVQNLLNFQINDQPMKSFREVQREVRLGYVNQSALELVKATKVEYPASIKIEYGTPYTYTTVGDDFDRLEVDVTFPNGIWYADPEKKALQPHTIDYTIQLRKVGSETWFDIKGKPSGGYARQVLTTARWGAAIQVNVEGSSAWENYLQDGNIKWAVWEDSLTAPGATDETTHKEGDTAYGVGYPDNLTWQWFAKGEAIALFSSPELTTLTAKSNKTKARRYTHTYKVPSDARGQYEVKISKLTEDGNVQRYGQDMYFGGVAEVHMDQFKYHRHVLLALRVRADDQLSGSIRVSAEIRGAIVRQWNGSAWVISYSNNPAWVAYDILTQPVFTGTGEDGDPFVVTRYDGMDPARIDHVKFKEWADYCDELVSDGAGGEEKRITFNGGFDYDTSMWEAFLRVCEVGRATPVWFGRTLTLAVDQPADPVNLYTVGNIEESKFKELFLQLEDRATEIEIDYVNQDTWERDKMTVYQPGGLGGHKASLELFGITKASEAWRAGMYRLMCNKYLIRTVEIDVDIEALNASIGDVVYIQHDVPQWGQGGRVVSANANTVTLDQEVTIEAGVTYKLLIRRDTDTLVERTIANDPGTYTTLTVSTPYVTYPQPYDVYAFGPVDQITKLFRILQIRKSMDQKCSLTCIEYRPEIYQYEESVPGFDTKGQQALLAMQPTSVVLTEYRVVGVDGRQQQAIGIEFEESDDPAYRHVEIWYQKARNAKNKSDWIFAGRTSGESYEIIGVDKYWTYEIKLLPVKANGEKLYLGYADSYYITIEGITRAADLLYSTGENVDDMKPDTAGADKTDDVTGGSGINIMNPRYSVFNEITLPPVVCYDTVEAYQETSFGKFKKKCLKIVGDALNGAFGYVALTDDLDPVTYNIKLTDTNKKWIISGYFRGPATGKTFKLTAMSTDAVERTIFTGEITVANKWKRFHGVLDFSEEDDLEDLILAVYNTSPSSTLFVDGLMIEVQKGKVTDPSAFALPSGIGMDASSLEDDNGYLLKEFLAKKITIATGGMFQSSPDGTYPKIIIDKNEVSGWSNASTREFYLDAGTGKAWCGVGKVRMDTTGITLLPGESETGDTAASLKWMKTGVANALCHIFGYEGASNFDTYLGVRGDRVTKGASFSIDCRPYSGSNANISLRVGLSEDTYTSRVLLRYTGTASTSYVQSISYGYTSISNLSDAQYTWIAGCSTSARGGNITLYGQDHSTSPSVVDIVFGSTNGVGGMTIRHRGSSSYAGVLNFDSSYNLIMGGTGVSAPATGSRLLIVRNATAPGASVADACIMYAADYAAGKCCMKFRTEDGYTITLYPGAALTTADNSTVDATYGTQEAKVITNLRTRVGQIESRLQAIGLLR